MIQTIFSSVGSFVKGLFNPANYTLHNLTLFLLVLMSIQYIPIESRAGVSPVKVFVMSFMPFVLLSHFRVNKALMWGAIYILWLFITGAIIHPTTFRASTVLYAGMFVITFIVVYTAVWDYHVLTLSEFLRFLRIFFYVLIGFLLAQQACLLVGITLMPVINLCQVLGRGIGANSLTFEPSTLGRVLAVMYYAILKCTEYQRDERVKITEIFEGDLKWISIFYAWAVLTMGSGTAFVAAGIISLYFMRGRYLFLAVPIFIGVYFALEHFGNESFTRAQQASIATMSGDSGDIIETDGSAATRIAPMLNTFNADFSTEEFWIGKGCDSRTSLSRRLMGHIDDYGFISYILELIIVFSCAIRFRSFGTLMFFLGVGGGVSNISYSWGILIILSIVYYFSKFNEQE